MIFIPRIFIPILVALLLGLSPIAGQAAPSSVNLLEVIDSTDDDVAVDTEDIPDVKDPAETEEKLNPYDTLIEEHEPIEGLFTFYISEDETLPVYMKIREDQLDKIYLLSPTIETGSGEKGMRGTTMLYEKPIKFHREPGIVQIIEVNTKFRAADDRTQRLLENMYSDSIITHAYIEEENEETGDILIDLGSIFLSDILGLFSNGGYRLDSENSKLGTLKSFPLNVNISSILQLRNDNAGSSTTLPDPRSMRVGLRYDISELPDNGYMPRYADSRVGYFTSTYMDFSDDASMERYRHHITRWHLEKKYPDKELSPPKEPIVYWLENTIPEKYHQSLTTGIEFWNDAFRDIGIDGAIEVKIMPEDADWDPADIRYNVIRWYSAYDASYAIGPSRVNPFTGEIYDADIGVSPDMLRGVYFEHLLKVGLLEDNLQLFESNDRYGPAAACRYGELSGINHNYSMNVLQTKGLMEPGSPEADEFVYSYLSALICHEVGHTLGLRHNFKASSEIPTAKLQDMEFTSKHGLTASVMDYDVANIAPPGVEQGHYHTPCVGDYDRWAIRYGYTILDEDSPEDELEALGEIASESAGRFHAYGTDEDGGVGALSIDPYTKTWDMGDDVFAYYEGSIENTKEMWGELEDYWSEPGTDYKWLRSTWSYGFWEYSMAARATSSFIGGIKHSRSKVGDPLSGPPYEPIPGPMQKKALRFFNEYLWAEDAFEFDADLINKLGMNRMAGFSWTVFLRPHDFQVHSPVLMVQASPLNWMYNPTVMSRIVDMQYKFPDGVEPFLLEDMFIYTREAIWDEIPQGRNVNSFRRNLQRYHLDILLQIAINPSPGTPEDARALARWDLVTLSDQIARTLDTRPLDYITRAHLSEIEARINAALDADIGY